VLGEQVQVQLNETTLVEGKNETWKSEQMTQINHSGEELTVWRRTAAIFQQPFLTFVFVNCR